MMYPIRNPELNPIITRTWDRRTGEFKWQAHSVTIDGFVIRRTPFKLMRAAAQHAAKLNKLEKLDE